MSSRALGACVPGTQTAERPGDMAALGPAPRGCLPGGVATVPNRFRLGKEGHEPSLCFLVPAGDAAQLGNVYLHKWTCPQARGSCRLTLSCVSCCGSCGFSVMQSSPGREALLIGSMGTHLQSDFYWGYSEVQIPVNTGMTAVTSAAVFTHAREFLQVSFHPVSSWVCHRLVGLG